MKSQRRLQTLLWPAILLCVWQPSTVRADDEALGALRQQVEELRQTVRQLQDRIEALEHGEGTPWVAATPEVAGTPGAAPAGQVPPPATKQGEAAPAVPKGTAPAGKAAVDDKIVVLRKSWRRINGDMTQDNVKEALGAPTREMLINGKVVWYYYYAGLGAGSVFFRGDGRVSSSQPPNVGWGF